MALTALPVFWKTDTGWSQAVSLVPMVSAWGSGEEAQPRRSSCSLDPGPLKRAG
jgi:hypothetical protein